MRDGILLSQVRNPFATPSAIGYVDSHVNSKNNGTAPIKVIEPTNKLVRIKFNTWIITLNINHLAYSTKIENQIPDKSSHR